MLFDWIKTAGLFVYALLRAVEDGVLNYGFVEMRLVEFFCRMIAVYDFSVKFSLTKTDFAFI